MRELRGDYANSWLEFLKVMLGGSLIFILENESARHTLNSTVDIPHATWPMDLGAPRGAYHPDPPPQRACF